MKNEKQKLQSQVEKQTQFYENKIKSEDFNLNEKDKILKQVSRYRNKSRIQLFSIILLYKT